MSVWVDSVMDQINGSIEPEDGPAEVAEFLRDLISALAHQLDAVEGRDPGSSPIDVRVTGSHTEPEKVTVTYRNTSLSVTTDLDGVIVDRAGTVTRTPAI